MGFFGSIELAGTSRWLVRLSQAKEAWERKLQEAWEREMREQVSGWSDTTGVYGLVELSNVNGQSFVLRSPIRIQTSAK